MITLRLNPPPPSCVLPHHVTAPLLYGILFLSLTTLHIPAPRWNRHTAFSQQTEAKAYDIQEQFHEKNLALFFLANKRTLTTPERQAFSSAGLMHLLAVSGGQLSVLLQPVSQGCGAILSLLFTPFLGAQRALGGLAFFSSMLSFGTAVFFASLFGAGGALLRVVLLTHAPNLPPVRGLVAHLCQLWPGVSASTIVRCGCLIVLAAAHGNPFLDPSFLLSALGASVVVVVHRTVARPCHEGESRWKYAFISGLKTQVCTTLLITIILFPLGNANPLTAAAANLLALPLVNFWITPLSLAVLVWPRTTVLSSILDSGLVLFHALAETFASTNVKAPSLSSPGALLYLATVCLCLWAILDGYEHNGTQRLRLLLQKRERDSQRRSRSSASVSTGIPNS